MHKLIRVAKTFVNRVGGTITDEWLWRAAHLIEPGWPTQSLAEESLAHAHRQILLDTITRYGPIESAFELGCGAGPNLLLLSQRFPRARLLGIDINRRAVAVGRKHMTVVGARNVDIQAGRFDNMSALGADAMDVVFTDAALIYVGPERIETILAEMLRVARLGIVLLEYGSESGTGQRNGHWAHDWRALFSRHVRPEQITLRKVTPATWSGPWSDYGYFVDVRLNHNDA